MIEEKWRKVTDWELYEVSNFGRIRNSKTGLIKKTSLNNRGYFMVAFEIGKRKKSFLVHRIVAKEFCERKEGQNVINHIDENPINNFFKNLEWCSQKHNVNEAIKSGKSNPKEAQKKAVQARKMKQYE
jgi:hypothetical protein